MSREIKFRGKRKDNGEWLYGYLGAEDQIIIWDNPNGISRIIQIIPETVGQFTGYNDIDGKDIYEGDILTYTSTGFVGEVIFLSPQFTLVNIARGDGHDLVLTADLKLIGNIHDNPKLLKEIKQ